MVRITRNITGTKEAALRAAREAACKVDHDPVTGTIPKELCRTCNPPIGAPGPANLGPPPAAPVPMLQAAFEIKGKKKRTPEQSAVIAEADKRWRNWVPTAKELSRPSRAEFIRRVKAERKADAPPAAKKASKQEKSVMSKTKSKARTPVGSAKSELREGSKQAKLYEAALAAGSKGATEADLCRKLGWKKCAVTLRRVCERMGATVTRVDGRFVVTPPASKKKAA